MATLKELTEKLKEVENDIRKAKGVTAPATPVGPIRATSIPTAPKIGNTAQSVLLNSKKATTMPSTNRLLNVGSNVASTYKPVAATKPADPLDEDALRLNMANNRTEPTAVMKALSFMGNNLYNHTVKPIGQAIDKQYEKLDDYNFGEKAMNDAHTTALANSQNAWDEDVLRVQRLQNDYRDLLNYMTPVQKMQYERVPDNKKKDFLDNVMAELQAKKGQARAEEILAMTDKGNQAAQVLGLAAESGLSGFKSGLKGAYNLMRGADKQVAKGASEYAYGNVRPNINGALGVAADLTNATANMAPSIALGLATGGTGLAGLGTAAMGVSSAGRGFDEAIGQGYDVNKAAAYGVASGITEAALQRIAGALPGVSGAGSMVSNTLAKFGDKAVSKIITNPAVASAVSRVVANAFSEGTEEAIQEALDVGLRNVLLGEDNKLNAKDIAYAGVLGGIMGGAFSAPNAVGAYRQAASQPISAQVELMKGVEVASPVVADKISTPSNVVSTNFNQNTVGSAAYNPEGLQAKVDEYGAIPQGEGPAARVSQIPVKIDDSNRMVSRFARTLVEAGVTPDVLVSPIEQEVLNGNFTHEVITNKKAQESALSHIKNEGYAKSLEDFETKVRNNEQVTKYDMALAQQLYSQAAQAAAEGDTNAGRVAMRLAADMVAAYSVAGDVVQSASMLKRTTPDGNLYALEKMIDKINKDSKKLKKVDGQKVEVKLNEELANNLLKSKNTAEMEANVEAIKKDIAGQVRVSILDAINKWRYTSMLLNPKTHMRNEVGNRATGGIYSLKDAVGVAVEGMVDSTSKAFGGEGIDKTKAILNRASAKDRALIDFAEKDFDTNGKTFTGEESKYSNYNNLREYTNPFTQNVLGEKLGDLTHGATNVLGNAINKVADWNFERLDSADTRAMKRAYKSAMAQYMKANGHTPEYYNSFEGANDASKAREYAARQAREATFHDANWLADKISEIENKSSLGGFVVGSFLPFKKTPMNIAKRAVEFSPVGVATGGIKAVAGRKNADTLSLALDELAKGLTGSSLIVIGAFLAEKGLVNGLLGSDDDKDRALKQLEGRQDYALNIGDKSITLDSFSPGIVPILAGAELYETWVEKEDLDFGDFVDIISSSTNPLIEMSLLSSINDLLTSVKYEDNAILAGVASAGKNYAGQFIPTVLSATARTIDPVDRTTYIDKNSNLGKTAQNVLMNAKYKTPGLHSGLEPKLDAWGRETVNDSLASRAFNNFINPTNVKSINKTNADLEVQRLYDATGSSSVVPKKPDKYFKVDGERVDLAAKEYTQYVKDKNYASYEDISKIVEMPEYKDLSDDDKAKVVEMVYEYNGIKAKEGLGKGYQSDDDKKIDALVRAGFDSAQAILLKQAVNNAANSGSTLSKSTKQAQTDFIQGLDLTASQKKALEDVLVSDYQIIYNDTSRSYTSGAGSTNNEAYVLSGLGKEANKAWPTLKKGGMSLANFQIAAGVMSNSNYSKKVDKVKQLMAQLDVNEATAIYIYDAFKKK